MLNNNLRTYNIRITVRIAQDISLYYTNKIYECLLYCRYLKF